MRGARESLTEPMQPARAAKAARASVSGRGREAEADAHLVGAGEQVGGIGVDPVRAGPLKLLPAVTAGQQADSHRPGAAGGEQVPDAVPDDERVPYLDAQQR